MRVKELRKENKRKASNASTEKASLAPYATQHNVLPINSHYNLFVYCIAIELHCVVKRLSVFPRHVKPLFSSVRYINNAETGARTHSQS